MDKLDTHVIEGSRRIYSKNFQQVIEQSVQLINKLLSIRISEQFQCIKNNTKSFNVPTGVISMTLREKVNYNQAISQMIIER